MNRVTLLLLFALLAFASCRQDSAPAEENASSTPDAPAAHAAHSNNASVESMKVNGFDFLDCDSLIVSKLVLTGPNGEGDFAYLKGECVTGKSFELLLVPRTGATLAAEFGDPTQVLAKAAKNNYKDYLCYAFELPKHLKANAAGENEVVDLFPINAVIKRLDNTTWVRLGQDRADDLSAYNTLRWNILHDNMPQYD
ncbi:MAG: hypothetical protein AB8F78_01315 [Saprospiraceae bacterium]